MRTSDTVLGLPLRSRRTRAPPEKTETASFRPPYAGARADAVGAGREAAVGEGVRVERLVGDGVTGRVADVVELSQRRLAHQSRDEAAFMHEHPEAFDWLERLVAVDADSAVAGFAAGGRPHFMEPHRSFHRPAFAAVARPAR